MAGAAFMFGVRLLLYRYVFYLPFILNEMDKATDPSYGFSLSGPG